MHQVQRPRCPLADALRSASKISHSQRLAAWPAHQALSASENQDIKGKEVTPFLLQYIADHTNGESLETNIALILNNAKVGAGIAVSYAGL